MTNTENSTRGFSPQLVLFDLDDTLCDHDGSLRVRLHAAFSAAFDGDPPPEIDAIVERSMEHSVFGTDHFAEILRPHGVTHEHQVEAAVDEYVADRYRGLQLFPEAVEVVNAIRREVAVGMITNGPSDI